MSGLVLHLRRGKTVVWMGILWVGATFAVCAQTPPSPPAAIKPPMDLVQESAFKIRLLEENGELVEVPGFTRREFLELLDIQRRLKEQQQQQNVPRVSFGGTIELSGRVAAGSDHAVCEVTFKIVVTRLADEQEATWISVPLRLDNSLVDAGSLQHEGEGEFFLDRQGAAFVGWLQAPPGSQHTIRLATKVRLETSGIERLFSLKLPNMTTTATLYLDGQRVVPRSRGSDLPTAVYQEQGTLLTMENGGGSVDFSWSPQVESMPFVESNGTLVFQVLGNRVWCEAQLRVRSRGAPIDSFIVHLPPEMELSSRVEAGYLMTPLSTGQREGRQSVLVKRLAGETLDPMQIRLEAALPELQSEPTQRRIDLSGFEVEGARPQWGSVEVLVEGNWAVNWIPGSFVQRTAPPDAARPQVLTARFLYDRQPYELAVELRQRQPRLGVTATYLLSVGKTRANLEARWRYVTTGTQLREVAWSMPGWTVDTVLPAELVAQPFRQDPDSLLTVPLGSAPAEFELTVKAHRDFPAEDGSVSIPLPRPRDLSLLPVTTVALIADDSIELTPRLASSRWLIQDVQPPSLELPASGATPRFFREELSPEDPTTALLVAEKRARPRETTLAVDVSAQIQADKLVVDQSITGNVAHVPLGQLALEVPQVILDSGSLTLGQDGEQLPYALLAANGTSDPAAGIPLVISEFAAERLGVFAVAVKYELPLASITTAAGLRIPLVQPREDSNTRVTGNVLRVTTDAETIVEPADERWFSDTESARESSQGVRLRAASKLGDALLHVSRVEPRRLETTAVPRAWIQSWITSTDRRDRVCFQLQTDEQTLSVQLPAGAKAEGLRVFLDGEAVKPSALSESGLLRVERVSGGPLAQLELWYWNTPSPLSSSTMQVELPHILGAERIERVYWHLVLPRDRLLLRCHPDLTSENEWHLWDWYRGTRGRLSQAALEELLGAQRSDSIPPATNQYLFSGTGVSPSVTFTFVERSLVLLLVSGAVLLISLPFVYLPLLRRPALLVVLGLVLASLAITYPEPAAVSGQAITLGLGMGLLGWLLHRIGGGSGTAAATGRGGAPILVEANVGSAPSVSIEGSSRATTESAPAHLRVARAQGEP